MRQTLTLLSLAIVLGCAGGEPALGEDGAMTSDRSPIAGKNPRNAGSENASSLRTESIAGAVAKISFFDEDGNYKICSATLIGRQVLLTAAHCGPDVYKAEFPQATNASYSVAKEKRRVHPNWNNDSNVLYDLALLWLERPVAPEVVRNIPKVFFGRIDQALQDGIGSGFDDDGLIVGYGRSTNCYVEQCGWDGTGDRRWGIAKDVGAGGPGGLMLGHETKESDEETTNRGDSGGPIFLRKQPGDEYVLAGVASFMTHDGNNQKAAFWAITGSARDIRSPIPEIIFSRNAEWLLSELGGDEDSDGVLDELDNCPPSLCVNRRLPAERCHNPDQVDEDGDSIGDVCDNCPPSLCAQYDGQLDCRNYRQIDDDGDGIGDVCDLCPGRFSRSRNEDLNGNLVGDFCEGCPATTRSPCAVGTTICNQNAGRCIFDYDGNGYRLPGLCERPPDRDKDGLFDQCDLCPDKYDKLNANANKDIESEYNNVAKMGDVCEPVPQLDFEPTLATGIVSIDELVQGSGAFGPDSIAFDGRALIGNDGTLKQNPVTREVVFRHCPCYNDITGLELSREKCIEISECLATLAADPDRPDGDWEIIHVRREARFGASQAVVFGALHEESQRKSEAGQYFWNWYEATQPHPSIPTIRSRTWPNGLVSTFGLVASVVSPNSPAWPETSSRDHQQNLRVVRRVVLTPHYATKHHISDIQLRDLCFGPHCLLFLPDMRHTYEPWSWIYDGIRPFFVDIRGTRLVLIGNDFAADESVRLAGLLWFLLRDFVFVPSIDTLHISDGAQSPESHVIGVLVPKKGIGVRNPVRVSVTGGMILPEPLQMDDDGSSLAVLSDNGRAFYSAREDAVYFVGGEDGTPEAYLRRFDFADGSTTILDRFPAATGDITGVTFDSMRNRIYILFREGSRSRLAFVDLGTGRFGDFPLYGVAAAMGLGPTGEVLFLFNNGGSVDVMAYDVTEDQLVVVGNWQRGGSLLGEPHPSLPIIVGMEHGIPWVSHLERSDFQPWGR